MILILVGLSFWTIAVHIRAEALPVEVRIAKPQAVVPVTAGERYLVRIGLGTTVDRGEGTRTLSCDGG